MVIFEGEELFLHYHEGNSDYIIISFMGIGYNHEAKTNFFLKNIVEKKNISCLGITTSKNNYYIHSDIEKIIQLCNKITKNFEKVIIIGLSMAGYAALKYSKRLNADTVFAMAPGCSVDQKVAPLPYYAKLAAEKISSDQVEQSTVRSDDLQGKIYLVYDPLKPAHNYDIEHAGFVHNVHPKAIIIPTFFSGHVVIHHLKGTEVFKSIIDCLVYGEDQDIIKIVSYIRRHNIYNIQERLQHAVSKHPLLVYKLIHSPAFAKVRDNHLLFENHRLMMKLSYFLNINGYQQESSECLKTNFLYNIQKSIPKQKQTTLSLNPYPYLININGCYLCYNFVTKKLDAMTNIAEKAHCIPLQLYKHNGKIKLVCIHHGAIFELKYHSPLLFDLSLLSDQYTSEHVLLNFSDYRVFIRPINKKHYIGISPEKVVHTAKALGGYEFFTPISMVSPEAMFQ